ncbi:MAG: hypothetical protein ACRDOG_06645 [Gaiellaceae bacterium]
MRRLLFLTVIATAFAALSATPALAVSGAGYTTVNTAVDGNNHCKNGNPGVNCNIYDAKEHVWLNGGPAANGLGPDGQYFFAVLAPGGQPDPNDGGAKNLSDDFDTFTNRTFTVSGGEVSAYAGTHDATIPLIRLFPYADTTNPGGVYIMAICSLEEGYPVDPRDCKYDAFKVKKGAARVQAVLSGSKYFDGNQNGRRDGGEAGLSDWVVTITGTDGTNTTVSTNGAGNWSFTTDEHAPASGTTTYTISEVQQATWTQTGNTVDQSMTAGGATVGLASFVYTVAVPNDAVSAVEQLNFGNVRDNPPECPAPTFGTNAQGVPIMDITVQDADTGLAAINVTYTRNITVDISGFFFGTKDPVLVRGTAIDPALSMGLTFEAIDLAGNRTICDPVLAPLDRAAGQPVTQTFTGLLEDESNVTITNGSPGLTTVKLVVNGQAFWVTGLGDGEERSLDVASAMVPGSDNRVEVTAYGPPGSTATLFIAN